MSARLFVPPAQLVDELVVVAGEDHRYLTRVLRLQPGDALVLFDGEGAEAEGRIVRVGPRALEVRIELRRSAAPADRPEVTLVHALTKADKLDLVVQKATELGVGRIIPVTSARAVPRLDTMRALSRSARWQKIAREAARQSGRADVPAVDPVSALTTALKAAPRDALKLLLWEGARQSGLRAALQAWSAARAAPEGAAPVRPARVVIAVGPEGGFADEEVEVARAAGFEAVGLGPRVLRTETAALVALSILGYVLGDLG